MSSQQVLIVEDEKKIADLLHDFLTQSGFATQWIANGNDVVPYVRENSPDIVLLDIMLPGNDGLSVCRELRSFSSVPIIMVTARVEEIDRLLGLELGADDYVCKPFSPREIVSRVRAILRRISLDPESAVDGYRGLSVDNEAFVATADDEQLDLTPVEFRLLALLLERPGKLFSRDTLIQNIYPDQRVVSDRTVDSHIKNLRRKLQAATGQEDWIHSVYGLGYKLE